MADFMQAIKWLKEGKKVRRESTSNKYWYVFLSTEIGSEGFIFLHYSNSLEPHLWHQSIDMLEANDWEIYEEIEPRKELLKKLKDDLEEIRKKCISYHSIVHFVDHNYKSWNNPVDGLDYALHKIDKYLEKKLT